MKIETNLNNATITDKQIESIAINIYKDIGNYYYNNFIDFYFWKLEYTNFDLVMTLEGTFRRNSNYKYDTVQYNEKEVM